MNKPKKSMRVREITAWHSADFSPHAGPHVRTHQCEHSLFIHVWTLSAGPQCGTRSADPHARTRQCECTFRRIRWFHDCHIFILRIIIPWKTVLIFNQCPADLTGLSDSLRDNLGCHLPCSKSPSCLLMAPLSWPRIHLGAARQLGVLTNGSLWLWRQHSKLLA